ncbi:MULTISPECIES: head GIN domain-containing protein [Altibacter]|uniref:head GIN domain-containing protein n=1 Tax=Altibacter TaxID=1535231 RepID=UPI0005529360|nr:MULTISPECIES: head GIN domain-containing protein [Altibacter]MCW8979944.1 DUF2807 domain-containing protein [Altibacter sp.]MCW9036697.1 DUF2807 domain-containing protein [Altibacter sp.]
MKQYAFFICSLVFFFSCDSEKAPDCIQATGDIVSQTYDVDAFKRIIVWNRVQLFISQGPQEVRVESGSNLIDEVLVRVEDSILKVSDRNSCNFVRDYGVTKVYVTAPDVEEIQNSSGLPVQNIGVIRFPVLTLVSEDPLREGVFHIDGDFIMRDLNVGSLLIRANGLSNFYLSGRAFNANFAAIDGDVRIEAEDFEIQNLVIFHRSTNLIRVRPMNSIQGKIVSLGNVYATNRPELVDVEELYQGRLIFE